MKDKFILYDDIDDGDNQLPPSFRPPKDSIGAQTFPCKKCKYVKPDFKFPANHNWCLLTPIAIKFNPTDGWSCKDFCPNPNIQLTFDF